MGNRARLLAATALAAVGLISSGSAYAQAANADQKAPSSEAAAGEAQTSEKISPEDILRDIVVTGRNRKIGGGLMIVQRQPVTTNSISAEAIEKKMALSGPYQLVASLPGVATGLSDPYQLSIRYALFLRGLPNTKIAYIIDGAPSYDRGYISSAPETRSDNENIAGMTVLPGGTRINDPQMSGVGGTIIQTIRDPSDVAGAKASYSYGTFRASRFFAGFDTGEIAGTGVKAFASISYVKAGAFALPEDASGNRLHVDFKISKEWGDFGKSTIFASYNDQTAIRVLASSIARFRSNQASGNYADGNYGFVFNPLSNTNNYYKSSIYTRRNAVISWNNQFNLSDRLELNINPYFDRLKSNSPGGSSLNPSSIYSGTQKVTVNTAGLFLLPNGNIPVKANLLMNEYAYGVNSFIKYKLSDTNTLMAGWWFDYWHMTQTNSFTPLSIAGEGADFGENALLDTSGRIVAAGYYKPRSYTNTFYIQDTQSLFDDKVKIEVGLKYLRRSDSGVNLLPGPQSDYHRSFGRVLPRASISWDINDRSQVYANVIAEARVNVPSSAYPNFYSVSTGAITQLGNLDTKPETSLGEELGYRYHDSVVTADIALFHKKLKDQTVLTAIMFNGANASTGISAGDLRMLGATAEVALRKFWGFTPYANAQYLKATTLSNLPVGTDFLPTKGKFGPQAPKWTATLGVDYENGPFFANFLFRHTGSQYSTFMNDAKMPSYHTIDIGAGYHLPSGTIGKDSVIRIAVSNLSNKPYLSTFASVTPTMNTRTGINGTTINGSAPTFWVGAPRVIMGTFQTSF